MNMKKPVALLLSWAMCLSLAACGSSAAQAQGPDTLTPSGSGVPASSPVKSADLFADVPADADYAEAVVWCYDNGLMNGVSADRFDPDGTLTRAMVATVLYRAEGEPAVTGAPTFTDTQAGTWYSNAVVWAADRGIVQGYGDGLFGTDDPVSVEQLEVMVGRYTGNGPEWVGDPARAVSATRAQAAAAFYAAMNEPEQTAVQDGFVEIGGGTFTMGSPDDEPERSSDEVRHQVTVGSFYLSPTEVSQKEYEAVMGSNPSGAKGDDLPVTDVTWYDAIAYCNALSRANGLTEAYTVDGTTVTWNRAADGYRLPTEAEWEYAARANTTTPFWFGDYVHNSDANCYNAYGYNNDASGNWVNGSGSYLRKTVEVTRYNANAYGLYNMHGNVAEWVWDWYGEYDAQADTDPTGPESGNAKIVRGGGWNDHPKHIRSAYRGAHPADVPLYSIGIRLARGASTGEVTSTSNLSEGKGPGKVLIAYFSQTGNTEGLANLIHKMSGVDFVRIERATPYSSSSNGPVLYGEALDELRAEATPKIKKYPDLREYDTILLGYCNWWSSIPASVRTLLTENDLSGKTIVPFCSMGGGHFGQTISAIAKLAPNSTIKEGLEVSYSSYDRDEIRAWLTENGIPAK